MSESSKKKASISKKGQVPWNKGKKCEYVSVRNRTNNPSKKGEKNHNWQGGRWNTVKRMAKERDDYTCRLCGLRDPEIMQADHIKPQIIFPELRHNLDNVQTLCPNCHARKTIQEKRRRYAMEYYKDELYLDQTSDSITHPQGT